MVLGSLLALVVSVCTSWLQSAAQRQQLLLDRKISALREYSRIGNKGNDILFKIKVLEFDWQNPRLSNAGSSKSAYVSPEYPSIISQTISWESELNVEGTIVTALFKEQTPRFTLSKVFRKSYPTNAPESLSIDATKKDVEFLRNSIIDTVEVVQNITEKLAQKLD